MKAVVVSDFGPIEATRIQDMPSPVPGSRQVLIDTQIAPANFADHLVVGGRYQFLPKPPFIPGKGPAGIVRAIGEGVTRVKVGDRILAMAEYGGYAQAVCVDEENCYRLPDSMPFEGAAVISVAFDTAWFALFERGRMQPGETVLVLGSTGAVGYAAVQLAKAKGAKVIAAISTPAKRDLVIEAGADHVIDLSRPDLRESLRQQVYEVNEGRGADVVIDPLGDEIFDAAIRAVAWRGRLVVVGFAAGRIPTLKINYVLLKNIEISGLQISDYRIREPGMVRQCFEELFDLYKRGLIKLENVKVYPLDDYVDVLSKLVSRQLKGRAAFRP